MIKIKLNAVTLNYFCIIIQRLIWTVNNICVLCMNVYDNMKKEINYRMREGLEKAENSGFSPRLYRFYNLFDKV